MTDNRTTDKLCKLLDERGEDYTRNDFGITWSYYSDPHTATESMDGTLIVTGLTPEQAIAATLGESDEGCYLMSDGKKFPVELDCGFTGIMPISITVGGFRYLLEVSNGK